MARELISSGSSFEKIAGYSRAVVDGDWIFVSGTTGFDYLTMAIDDDLGAQVHQCFRNIVEALGKAEAGLEDVVRVHYYLSDPSFFELAAPLFGAYFGKARPAATATVCRLIDPRMKIEIEVTARRKG